MSERQSRQSIERETGWTSLMTQWSANTIRSRSEPTSSPRLWPSSRANPGGAPIRRGSALCSLARRRSSRAGDAAYLGGNDLLLKIGVRVDEEEEDWLSAA
jgi:hypothetical protein